MLAVMPKLTVPAGQLQLATYEGEYNRMASSLDSVTASYSHALEESEGLRAQVAGLKREAANATAREAAMETKLQSAVHDKTAAERKLEDLYPKVALLVEEVAGLQQEKRQLQQEVSAQYQHTHIEPG